MKLAGTITTDMVFDCGCFLLDDKLKDAAHKATKTIGGANYPDTGGYSVQFILFDELSIDSIQVNLLIKPRNILAQQWLVINKAEPSGASNASQRA